MQAADGSRALEIGFHGTEEAENWQLTVGIAVPEIPGLFLWSLSASSPYSSTACKHSSPWHPHLFYLLCSKQRPHEMLQSPYP